MLAMLEEEDQETRGGNIILPRPPSPKGSNELTDVDPDSTDEETPGNINHLESGLLNAPCEFQPREPFDSELEVQAAPSKKGERQTESVKLSKKLLHLKSMQPAQVCPLLMLQ